MGHFLGTMYPFLAQHYTLSLFCHPEISPHTKFWSFQTIWEGKGVHVYACVCVCVHVSLHVFFLIICLLWFMKLGDWVWFLFSIGGRWHRATFKFALHFPLLSCRPAPAIVCLTHWHCPSQLFTQSSSPYHSFTFSSLSICVWLPYSSPLLPIDFFFLSVRIVLFFNICLITFPAVVVLPLFQTFSLSSLIPFPALSRTVICVCHPSVIHTDYSRLPKPGSHNKLY